MQFLKRFVVCQRFCKEEDGFKFEHSCFQAVFFFLFNRRVVDAKEEKICSCLLEKRKEIRFIKVGDKFNDSR